MDGHPTVYSIWSTMNKQEQGYGMAYINVKKRITRLVKLGIVEEIKPDKHKPNIRGKREYRCNGEKCKLMIKQRIQCYDEYLRKLEQILKQFA